MILKGRFSLGYNKKESFYGGRALRQKVDNISLSESGTTFLNYVLRANIKFRH